MMLLALKKYLAILLANKGSDLLLTVGFPPALKVDGRVSPYHDTDLLTHELTSEQTRAFAQHIMTEPQYQTFVVEYELNFALAIPDVGRFRVNAFMQQGHVGLVFRHINTRIPDMDALKLPASLKDLVMVRRGIVFIVGGTGMGKSTTQAVLLDHINQHSHSHIISIEDPIEYLHTHKNSIVTQREVGVDTFSWETALHNALRQAPDVLQIGEVRDAKTMSLLIQFAETGHLVLATLHANNAYHAFDRMVNFFPENRRPQLLMDLAFNLHAIVAQRLIPRESPNEGRIAAVELMLNTPLIADLILKGQFVDLREAMRRSHDQGMLSFDQHLFLLYEQGLISYDNALRFSDSVNDLRINIKLNSQRGHGGNETRTEWLAVL